MVTGFNSNDAPLQGEMYGTVFMHAVGVDEQDAVGSYRMSMTTIPGLLNTYTSKKMEVMNYSGTIVPEMVSLRKSQGWEILWKSDGKTSIFDRSDMIRYAVNKVHGDKVTNPGTSVSKKSDSSWKDEERQLMQAKNDLFKGMAVYVTKNNDHFIKICDNIGIRPQERRYYLEWLQQEHNIGVKPFRFEAPPGELPKARVHLINDPFGKGKQTRFSAGVHIP